jgi:hypothetical protein
MPQPKLSKSVQSLQEARNQAAAAALADEPQLTPEQVAALEADKADTVARLRATSAEMNPTPAPRPSLADLLANAGSAGDKLAALDAAERDGQRAVEEDDRAKAEAMIAPYREKGHAAVTRMGILKAKYGERVAKTAALDLRAVLKRVPPKVEPGKDYAPNHFAVEAYVRLARELADSFRTFSAVDFTDAVRSAESYVYRGASSPEFVNDIRRHLPWHTKRLVASVAGVDERLARLDQLEAEVAADLAGVELLDAAPDPKPDVLPRLDPTPPRRGTTSAVEFDPREHPNTWLPKEARDVTRIGPDGEGVRVGDLSNIPKESRDVKIYGVAQ